MRIGNNPNKDKIINKSEYFHQVIVPIHIPNLNGYFSESFKVFKLSIDSLIKTSHRQTFISIISNGSCKEVNSYIQKLFNNNQIHEYTITTSIGKLNSILKGLSGTNLPLVTISDADVLFLNGWQKASYEVFNNFPRTGVVCPVPNPSLNFTKTSNIIRSCLWNKNIQYSKVKNDDSILKFAQSIGRLNEFREKYINKCLTISNGNYKAVVGAGHFVSTYKTGMFDFNFFRKSNYLLGANSEEKHLDNKAIEVDLWRLSTEDNYAFHLGNMIEPWHKEIANKLKKEDSVIIIPDNLNVESIDIVRKIYNILLNRFFDSKKLRGLILNRFLK